MLLPIVLWLAVYVLLLYLLGGLVHAWRERTWFKVIFLPGVLLAVVLAKAAAALCLGVPSRASPVENGRPPFDLDTKKVPCLAGALFFLVCHFFTYLVFLVLVTHLSAAGLIETDLLSLPELHAEDLMEGYIEVDARSYVSGLAGLSALSGRCLLLLAAVFYVAAGVFASLTLTGKQCRWSLLVLGALGALAYVADWFGVGFPFLTRGWWARIFYFPEWWALFSLYVTSLVFALFFFAGARAIPAVARAVRGRKKRG